MSENDVSRDQPPPKGRWLPVTVAAMLGLVLGAGAYAWRTHGASDPAPAASSGQPAIGGPFQLIDQNGRAVDEQLLRGKWTAVFFGFTYCPDVCPATLQTLEAATGRLGTAADDLQVVLISVDPERDTPEALKSYVSGFRFPGGLHALTGTPDQVRAAARAWRAYYRKSGEGPDYTVDHFTSIYLMDPEGRFSRLVGHGLDPQQTAAQIRAAMAERPSRA
jgi:protein SCO1/2